MYPLRIILVCTLIAIADSKNHVFTVDDSSSGVTRPWGKIIVVNSIDFPVLKHLSLRRVVLEASGVREPHWHANANELAYCLRGSALVTIFGNSNEHDTFTVTEGEMFFVPSGFLHHMENLNPSNESSTAEFIIAFTHALPQDFGFSRAFGAMTDAVLGNTFQLPSSAWKGIVKRGESTIIGTKRTLILTDHQKKNASQNKYKFNVEKSSPSLLTPEGSVKKASKSNWPILEDTSMNVLRLSTTGMREPHWHPEAGEMGYVVHGYARMTVLSPTGDDRIDRFTLKAGDVYFVPAAYSHHIENIGQEEVKVLVFFDKSAPGDIGFTGSYSAYSREVIAAMLQCSPSQLPQVPFSPKDLLIVKRVNPTDV